MHTCSLCGGNVIQQVDDIILKFPQYVAVLEKAEIGECVNCGERYYPASTSERIQARMSELLQSRVITEKDRKKGMFQISWKIT
jgi:YgiT-type zinc finger domain-containing protein